MEIYKEIFYTVYKITNKINKRIYIGVHKTSNIYDNYMGSGSKLLEDMKNIGIQNFEKEILFVFDNKEDMLLKEKELVNKDFIKDESTYNLMLGGGFFCGELTKDTIVIKDGNNKYRIPSDDIRYLSGELSGITKGYITVKDSYNNNYFVKMDDVRYLSGEFVPIWKGSKKSKESKDKITGVNNPFYGKKHTEESKIKISNANKLNIGELNSFYGKKHTEETKEKMSIIGKELHKSGKNLGFLGKKHTKDTKRKMSLIDRSREKNSQFGTCWINNLELKKNKKIKKEYLDIWLLDGWIKGLNKEFYLNKQN